MPSSLSTVLVRSPLVRPARIPSSPATCNVRPAIFACRAASRPVAAAPVAPATPAAPVAPFAPVGPAGPAAPDGPATLQASLRSPFLHFFFAGTTRIAPLALPL